MNHFQTTAASGLLWDHQFCHYWWRDMSNGYAQNAKYFVSALTLMKYYPASSHWGDLH